MKWKAFQTVSFQTLKRNPIQNCPSRKKGESPAEDIVLQCHIRWDKSVGPWRICGRVQMRQSRQKSGSRRR